jgi:hypothetical protein
MSGEGKQAKATTEILAFDFAQARMTTRKMAIHTRASQE